MDFTSSTFSFNLPSPPKATSKVPSCHNHLHLNYLRTPMLMFTSKSSKLCDFLHSSHHTLKQVNEEFAQKFVDLLCLHPTYMKPCVSFGQDNDLVYCTVPATSTQGAISAEDKAKQARGGVQLVRFSLLFQLCRAVEAVF